MKDYVMVGTQGVVIKGLAFLAKIAQIKEPQKFEEAAKDPAWAQAMENELRALE